MHTSPTDPDFARKRQRSQRTLLLLWGLFLAPPAAALLLFLFGDDWVPKDTTNQGELIHPARHVQWPLSLDGEGKPLPDDRFAHFWTLAYVGDATCDETCQKQLWTMRQVRMAQNQHADRVAAVYVVLDGGIPTEYDRWKQGFRSLRLERIQDHQSLLDQFRVGDEPDEQVKGRIYLIDPLGNLMIRYGSDQDPSDIRKDVKKLLKISTVR